ncbi:hypothetical protein CDD81_4503 [Ophiocordyceps australis]|uniref:Protein kinase domain-containing protein n=1 Tax=Ophiocordyceps australis TaxID=1399860 RepID=A0A2C5XMQ8_9HYPO|nr:hypothetical protein CDD81_4503 [Ophiocordyceps australis]
MGADDVEELKRSKEMQRLVTLRNVMTMQSALIRGDDKVVLEGPENISKDKVLKRVRKLPSDLKRGMPYARWWRPRRVAYPGEHGWKRSLQRGRQPACVPALIPQGRTWDGLKLHWIKVLGTGGSGIATLWEAVFENGERLKVVIKMAIDDSVYFDSRRQLGWHQRYGRSRHTVRALDLPMMIAMRRMPPTVGSDAKFQLPSLYKPESFNDARLNVLTLEYMDQGSLYEMMVLASRKGIRFSNKVLWEMWECLVRAVGSVAYEPVMPKESMPFEDCVDDFENRSIRIPVNFHTYDVHFDLDEHNVLLHSNDQVHSCGPVLKLHDFGAFSHNMRECWQTWNYKDYLAARQMPKINRALPEQIHENWDGFESNKPPKPSFFSFDNITDNDKSSLAGIYGPWSNVYLIGSLMESVITHNWIAWPMKAELCQTSTGQIRSYGWRLQRREYSWVDRELVDVLIRCQSMRPYVRPHMLQLAWECEKRRKKGFSETDDETRAFWKGFWEPPRAEAFFVAEQRRQQTGHRFSARSATVSHASPLREATCAPASSSPQDGNPSGSAKEGDSSSLEEGDCSSPKTIRPRPRPAPIRIAGSTAIAPFSSQEPYYRSASVLPSAALVQEGALDASGEAGALSSFWSLYGQDEFDDQGKKQDVGASSPRSVHPPSPSRWRATRWRPGLESSPGGQRGVVNRMAARALHLELQHGASASGHMY